MAPLDSVNLSGALVPGFLSSTLACTLPLDWRSGAAIWADGAMPASFLRKSLKSLLWAITVRVASLVLIACACSGVGTFSSAPLLIRLILLLMNASGLARNSATSIWSRETLAGLTAAAILLAVSPGLTVTWRSPAVDGSSADDLAGDLVTALGVAGAAAPFLGVAVAGRTAIGMGSTGLLATGGLVAPDGAAVTLAGVAAGTLPARRLGGSNSIVKSRTMRPDDQLASRIMSTKGSLTGLSLVKRM